MNLEDRARERAERIIRMVKEHDPKLKYPGKLTNEIMGSLEDIAQVEGSISIRKNKTILLNINFRRLVAAAAIILLGILAYEQYLVLDRINCLEAQLEETALRQGPASSTLFLTTWETRAMMNFRKIKDNNRTIAEKVLEVREMMKAADRNPPARSNNYRERALSKYNNMIIR